MDKEKLKEEIKSTKEAIKELIGIKEKSEHGIEINGLVLEMLEKL